MATESERKFLVANDDWRERVDRSDELLDGIVARTPAAKVRVRLSDHWACLTIKSQESEGVRREYEYEISVDDAAEIIATMCGDQVLEKVRHYLHHDGFEWVVDEYKGVLSGVVIAEVELSDISTTVPLPDWIGREVTSDPEYKKFNMLRTRLSLLQKQSELKDGAV